MGKLMKFSLFALLVAGIALALVDPTPADAWNKEVISVRCGFDNGPNVWEVRQCGSSLAGICGNDEPCDELEGNGDGASANCAVCLKTLLDRSFKLEHINLNAEDGEDQFLMIGK